MATSPDKLAASSEQVRRTLFKPVDRWLARHPKIHLFDGSQHCPLCIISCGSGLLQNCCSLYMLHMHDAE